MCSAVNPIDPTRSGRPHDPMNRVSPVNAYRAKMVTHSHTRSLCTAKPPIKESPRESDNLPTKMITLDKFPIL